MSRSSSTVSRITRNGTFVSSVAETARIKRYFDSCKVPAPSCPSRLISNADISEAAIESILSENIPNFAFVKLDNFELRNRSSVLHYDFKLRGSETLHTIKIYQCDSEEEAEDVFKCYLWGHTAPEEYWPQKISKPALGSYSVGNDMMVRWVRHSIFMSIELFEGFGKIKIRELAEKFDQHFAAASARPRGKICPRHCVLETPSNMVVEAGGEFSILVRIDEDHLGTPSAFVDNTGVASCIPSNSENPRELRFWGCGSGRTVISLWVVHNKTFHRLQGPVVSVKVKKIDEDSELARSIQNFREMCKEAGYE
ncbi:hypothetical protein TWF481_006409 [Arthrobotrys musiformis]|uniref:Uncharacterized protein n=1 Tax=Arthrobotrys musiformis TaxID=47236 RepID=A0AAV9WGK6_9PEZI